MKKIFFLLVLAHTIFGYSETSSSFEKTHYSTYVDIHLMGGLPMVGVGVRTKTRIHAFDFSGNICPLNPPSSLKNFHLRSLYLAYPKQTGLYFGVGLGLLNEPETIKVSGSGEGAIGYHWENGIFLEGNIIVPFKQSKKSSPVWPGFTLGVGF
jgi:hypothetical protein